MVKKKDKISLPASGAGLIRYMEIEGKGPKIKPEHVLFGAGALVLLEAMMKFGLI